MSQELPARSMPGCGFRLARDLARPVPKYRFPDDATLPRDAFQLVSDELMLDGNPRQNLATFCQTWEEPEVLALMALSINKNMIDRDEYPQTAEIEARCVHMMADLWNAPQAANTVGTSAIGSSEASMLAGMAARWRWRAKRAAAGQPADRTWCAARCRWCGTSSPGNPFDLADRLRNRGWQVPACTLTGTAAGIAVQRIVVRIGVSPDMASLLLDDFRGAVAHFSKHPVTVPMTKQESGGFSHL